MPQIYDMGPTALLPLRREALQSLTKTFILYTMYNGIYVRATCFDLVGHPLALQEHRFKSYLYCNTKKLYVSTTVFIITQGNMRATCFD